MIKFTFKNPAMTDEHLGIIPHFISIFDERPVAVQIDENYSHGGGWRKANGFTMDADGTIQYKGEKPLPVLAEAKLRDETLRFYDYAWFAIVQSDGTFEIARLD